MIAMCANIHRPPGRPKKRDDERGSIRVPVTFNAAEGQILDDLRGKAQKATYIKGVLADLHAGRLVEAKSRGQSVGAEVRQAVREALQAERANDIRLQLVPSEREQLRQLATAMGHEDLPSFIEDITRTLLDKPLREVRQFYLGRALGEVDAKRAEEEKAA